MTRQAGYILGPLIARGGMAEIFLGKVLGDDGFGRLCAIKRILPHHAQEKEFIRMFRDEAHICKRLQHANIVQVYDFQEVDGSYAIIMEFIDGSDLRSLLAACEKAGQRLSIPMAVYLAAQAARGLHYAHTKIDEITHQPLGIVHRDISPQNILISFEGEVKITDFGIADAQDKVSETLPGTVKGKYSYMSPEQIAIKELDARSDIFALAIVLWETLAMRRLFSGKNEIETIKRVQSAEIRYKLTDLNDQVDDELFSIINKGLAKERKHRYQTAAHFEKDLLRYVHSRYPDFTSNELGAFIKKVMAKRRGESAADIRKTLTSTNLKGPSFRGAAGSTGSSQNREAAENWSTRDEAKDKHAANADLDENEKPSSALALKINLDLSKSDLRPLEIAANNQTGMPGAIAQRTLTTRTHLTNEDSQSSPLRYSIVRSKFASAPKKQHLNILLMITAILCLGVIWHLLTIEPAPRMAESARHLEQFNLQLATVPRQVKLSLGERALYGGRYVQTPIEIRNLPSGQHVLTIARPGYRTMRLRLDGQRGETVVEDKLVLERDPQYRRAPTILHVKGIDKVDYLIDDGLHRGTVSRNAPQALDDLGYGSLHRITIANPNGEHTQCRFTPRSSSFSRPFELNVVWQNNRFSCTVKAP